jgi:hypothetical protein
MDAPEARHGFTAHYDESLVRDAIKAFIWRRAILEQRMMWFISLVMAGASLYFIVWGDAGWIAGVMLVVALLPPIFFVTIWRSHHVNTLGRFHRLGKKQAEISMDAGGIEIRSDLGSGQLAWRDITEVWERPRSFMVFSGDATFNTMPREGMPPEMQARLRALAVPA